MFTGIIENQAVLERKSRNGSEGKFRFRILGPSRHFRRGESVALDGVCLTVSNFRGKGFSVDLLPETLQSTTLGGLSVGERVNVERELRLGDGMGGHWVMGHVDGVGTLQRIERRKDSFRLQIQASLDIMRRLVRKGSVAVDGISFTLQEVRKRSFVIGVTPHTFRVAALQWKRPGDQVNLEVDLMARLVEHFLSKRIKKDKA